MERTLASQMSDAQLEEQMLRLTNNHGELFTASGGEVLLLRVS
jgi:DNA topoisomerase IA